MSYLRLIAAGNIPGCINDRPAESEDGLRLVVAGFSNSGQVRVKTYAQPRIDFTLPKVEPFEETDRGCFGRACVDNLSLLCRWWDEEKGIASLIREGIQ